MRGLSCKDTALHFSFNKVSCKMVTVFPCILSLASIPIVSETKAHNSLHKPFLASRETPQ